MPIHIKRDGAFFCKLDLVHQKNKQFQDRIKEQGSISFTDAHKVDLNKKTGLYSWYCSDCVKIYFEKIAKLKTPIIIKSKK